MIAEAISILLEDDSKKWSKGYFLANFDVSDGKKRPRLKSDSWQINICDFLGEIRMAMLPWLLCFQK